MPKKRSKQKNWSMYPDLHDDVAALLENDGLHFVFHTADDESGAIKQYDTNIMGRFTCHNQNCGSPGWSSKQIAVTIRLYYNDKYNARVYYQRCRRCYWACKPILDGSYAERISYRIKKWSGIAIQVPNFSRESKGPHRSELCEGCKNGHCSEGK